MKIIGIVGTRKRDRAKDHRIVEEKFFEIYEEGDWICSGGCPQGGDRFADKIARKYGIPILTFYPNWTRYGKGAGMIRNTTIAENSNSLIICGRTDGEEGGAEDTMKKFLNLENKRSVHSV